MFISSKQNQIIIEDIGCGYWPFSSCTNRVIRLSLTMEFDTTERKMYNIQFSSLKQPLQ